LTTDSSLEKWVPPSLELLLKFLCKNSSFIRI
jgi:hypothetical protein